MANSNATIGHRKFDLLSEVRKVDKAFDRSSRVSPEYEFSARTFERINANFLPYTFDVEHFGGEASEGDEATEAQ